MEGAGQLPVIFPTQRSIQDFECVKLRSFVQPNTDFFNPLSGSNVDFRLVVVALFRVRPESTQGNHASPQDLLDVHMFHGWFAPGKTLVREMRPKPKMDDRRWGAHNGLQPDHLTQVISFDKILDFDVLYHEKQSYLALVRMELGIDSNSKFKLLFYQLGYSNSFYDEIGK